MCDCWIGCLLWCSIAVGTCLRFSIGLLLSLVVAVVGLVCVVFVTCDFGVGCVLVRRLRLVVVCLL